MIDELEHYSVTINYHLETTLLVASHESESNIALIQHRLPSKKLGGPMHQHSQEEEISYILQGTMAFKEGSETKSVN